jgi:hypothetical protein
MNNRSVRPNASFGYMPREFMLFLTSINCIISPTRFLCSVEDPQLGHNLTETFSATLWGARGSVVVEALCYKPEGRGIACR